MMAGITMMALQAKNCCVRSNCTSCAERQARILLALVTQQFYTAYRAQRGPHEVGGAEARPERLFK